jgi:membrane-associated protein
MVRTFSPIVAGADRMRCRTLIVYDIIGGTLWGVGVTVLG